MATTKFVCKHCKVAVLGRGDYRPVLGKEHKRSCPRSRPGNTNAVRVK